jgi:hypothetical protein
MLSSSQRYKEQQDKSENAEEFHVESLNLIFFECSNDTEEKVD